MSLMAVVCRPDAVLTNSHKAPEMPGSAPRQERSRPRLEHRESEKSPNSWLFRELDQNFSPEAPVKGSQ